MVIIKIEAESCADPVWCAVCGSNLDLDEFPLSKELTDELWQWNLQYHHWLVEIDYEDIKKMDAKWVTQHNEWGLILAEKVQNELGSPFRVTFSPIHL
ncbi:hypothetical protein [Lihuaxuella thermophila]|uniref:hypothetical protein n=1 Tax=Lihuaxuella thermophila TaxID=1173111 RepID=UPI000B7E1703|nr:hypothetical protein [Lihuaxuella thermophila]